MKANELRIGNWYQEDWITGEFSQITVKDIEFLVDDPLDDHYRPIEITEEWLLKFGFEESYQYYMFPCPYNLELGYFGSINGSKKGYVLITLIGEMEGIRYVHQLQNLFFALTGKELTI